MEKLNKKVEDILSTLHQKELISSQLELQVIAEVAKSENLHKKLLQVSQTKEILETDQAELK